MLRVRSRVPVPREVQRIPHKFTEVEAILLAFQTWASVSGVLFCLGVEGQYWGLEYVDADLAGVHD